MLARRRRAFTGVNDFQTYALSLLSPSPRSGDIRRSLSALSGMSARAIERRYAGPCAAPIAAIGVYGEPTGNAIRIIGISHHVIKDGLIENEWSIFDEFALLKQICL